MARLLLPVERALQGVPGQGWRIGTTVRPSRIPGAGNGRFADEPALAGACLTVKPLLPMRKVARLAAVPADVAISFDDVDDLEAYVGLSTTEGGHTRAATLRVFSHFLWSQDGRRVYLNSTTWSINHADDLDDGLNIRFFEHRGKVVGSAAQDVGVGDELRNDYRKFEMPGWYLEFCEEHGLTDVRTSVMTAVYGPGQPELPRRERAEHVRKRRLPHMSYVTGSVL